MLCQLVCLDRRYQRMNCFNIREFESLLKARFFPDLLNSHDYRRLLNNSIIGLRLKTNNLSPTDHSIFLFNQYGLLVENENRQQFFLTKVPQNNFETIYDVSNFLFFMQPYLDLVRQNFFQTDNILTSLLLDLYILFLNHLSYDKKILILRPKGLGSFSNLLNHFLFFLKSELERQLINFFSILDFKQKNTDIIFWVQSFKISLLDKFLFGYMENNIGLYAFLTKFWPVNKHPDILTDGGFPEFYVTAIHRILSKSFFLYAEVS